MTRSARHADDGLVVVGIVYQDRSQAARDFMARNGATWAAAADPDGRVADAYGILAPPETFFIGRDGTIVARVLGQFSAATLDDKVAADHGGVRSSMEQQPSRDATGRDRGRRARRPRARRPLSVAFLPLALVAFIILALVIAAWTFLAAATWTRGTARPR